MRPRVPPAAPKRTAAVGAARALAVEEEAAPVPLEAADGEPEPEAVVLAEAPLEVDWPGAKGVGEAVPDKTMYEEMQALRQAVYASVAALDPSPWSQLATQFVVAFIWASPGCGTPTQPAWQFTSVGAQAAMQVSCGVKV